MSNSYKFYSDTKDIMKKYVNATEGAIIYGISKSSHLFIRYRKSRQRRESHLSYRNRQEIIPILFHI